MSNPKILGIPPLRSGGLMLSYRCNQSCGHCAYRCGPDAGGWMEESVLEITLEGLSAERRLIDIHLAGGEPTLNPGLLTKAILLATRHGIRISYMETNGAFDSSPKKARETLRPLRDAGLPAILLSVSPYHNEFTPLSRTLNCLEAGLDIFGEEGVFPWLDHFFPMLARMDPETTHSLDEFMAVNGITNGRELLQLFPLTPGGRVPEKLGDLFVKGSPDQYRHFNCREILFGVSHFHIDPEGNLFTGHCPGIVSATAPELHPPKTAENSPIFWTLAKGGPYALMEAAGEVCGFEPNAEGYVSPCDLCFQIRLALLEHSPKKWPELAPATFYRG